MTSVAGRCSVAWKCLTRKKEMQFHDWNTPLNRCLSTLDLAFLGISNMIGSGIYILTGNVIRNKAGPSVTISYLISGLVALLNALCYAELSARIPKAGSAYTYTYVAAGEFLAFMTGWSMVLEYVLSVSSVARAWSATLYSIIDAISGVSHQHFNVTSAKTNESWVSIDFLGAASVLTLAVVVSFGPKLSTVFNTGVTLLNLTVVGLLMAIMFAKPYKFDKGFTKTYPKASRDTTFMPFGFQGVLAGAGTCFYAFIGFDAITVSSEEAREPTKTVPVSICISVAFVTIILICSSLALIMFVPWTLVDISAPFTMAFMLRDMRWMTHVAGVGSFLGLTAGVLSSVHVMPRIMYAMAVDGLLPKALGYVHPPTQVPLVSLVMSSLLAALLALILSLDMLADFLSIGTLLGYTMVSVDVFILRYSESSLSSSEKMAASESNSSTAIKSDDSEESKNCPPQAERGCRCLSWLLAPNSGVCPLLSLVIFIVASGVLCWITLSVLNFAKVFDSQIWLVILAMSLACLMVCCCLIMGIFPQHVHFRTFKVPWVPVLPCLCILVNISLITKLSPLTWVRFGVWTVCGLLLYFVYGVWSSMEREKNKQENEEKALLSDK